MKLVALIGLELNLQTKTWTCIVGGVKVQKVSNQNISNILLFVFQHRHIHTDTYVLKCEHAKKKPLFTMHFWRG